VTSPLEIDGENAKNDCAAMASCKYNNAINGGHVGGVLGVQTRKINEERFFIGN